MKELGIGIMVTLIGIIGIIMIPLMVSDQKTDEKQLKTAVYVGDGGIQKENEGRLVIVTGKLNITEPAYDPDNELEFPTLSVRKITERMEIRTEYDQEKERDRTIYSWQMQTKETAEFYGKATISGYRLADSLLKRLPKDTYSDYDKTLLNEKNLFLYEDKNSSYKYFLIDKALRDNVYVDGAMRYRYSAYMPKDKNAVTLVGIQRGDALEAEANTYFGVMDGILSFEELMKQVKKNGSSIWIFLAVAVGFILTGIVMTVSVVKKRSREHRLEEDRRWGRNRFGR